MKLAPRLIRARALRFMLALTVFFSLFLFAYPRTANAQTVYPTPSFVYSPLTPRVGDVVTFDALWWEKYWIEENGYRSFSYSWDFGDGTSATGATVSHVFTNAGIFNVEVTLVETPPSARHWRGAGHETIVA